MPPLDSSLRSQLDNVCQKARELAVAFARSALEKRAVDAAQPLPHFGKSEKVLRNRLRARGRQAGDTRQSNGTQTIERLSQELAYEYWHRMLFARFLAENHLLMHPDGVSVSLEECAELAPTANPPAANGFALAARFAGAMLPLIFRADDVLSQIEFAPEQRLALEKLLAGLPAQTFTADDSLGWVYQFWQTAEKKRVNESGEKIDGAALPAVTQLFTEHYMVEFLLHNTLGAWWCAKEQIRPRSKHGFNTDGKEEYLSGIDPCSGGASAVPLPGFEYLRWRDDGTPAAGKFEGWPRTLAEFTLLDPCCGSGHFLVAAFNLLVPLRMREEGLTAAQACQAVLRDNLFGLELDPRCTQIAAFALALAAWKFVGEDGQPLGHRPLPPLNIACTGIGPRASEDEWMKLAEQGGKRMTAVSREPILAGLRHLYALFSEAPTLGSLIDPGELAADLITADFETLKPYLAAALAAETSDDAHEHAVAAAGMIRAAQMLAAEYTLVVTNVPYLGRGKQADALKRHVEKHYPSATADLATALVLRCADLCREDGSTALVTPQNWFFLTTYKKLRAKLLKECSWNVFARLGPRAFETISGEVVNVALLVISAMAPTEVFEISGFDVSASLTASEKAARLMDGRRTPLRSVRQANQLLNPDATVTLEEHLAVAYLGDYAKCLAGILNGDSLKFRRVFWEFPRRPREWVYQQSTVGATREYHGREGLIFFDDDNGHLREDESIRREKLHDSDRRGNAAWGKRGVGVSQMDQLPVTLYTGEKFDSSIAVILPHDQLHVPALWAYCTGDGFRADIRRINQKVSVENGYLTKIPFDLAHWQAVATEKYPNGLPEPHSDDPTQWLFKGDIATSTEPLQVAVARLLGYRWPEQPETPDAIDQLADRDGIVCLSSVRGEAGAAERLREVLRAAYQERWSGALAHDLLAAAGAKSAGALDDWLRNQFFEQHARRFHHRPFIWHLWDGRKDGFAALVNYHKLNHQALENLTYSYLGDWIALQRKSDKPGADLRLAAAEALREKLKLILAGEPPYDIFVRWKPLAEQALGWRPDLNDGVRMNIRPFLLAGVLRKSPNIKWSKDRGKEPRRERSAYPWFWSGDEFIGDRLNDLHLTLAEKQAARDDRAEA